MNPTRAVGIPHPSRVRNDIHIGNVIALVPHLLRGLLPLPRGARQPREEESLQLYLFPFTPIIRPNSRFGDSSPQKGFGMTNTGNVIALVPHLLRGLLPLPRGADECSEEESPQLCLFPLTPIYEPNSCCRDSSPQKGFGMTNGCLTMKVKGLPCV